MTAGQQATITMHDAAHGGEAVGRVDGKAVFVAGAIPGETITATITKDGGSWARATLEQVVEPSADRVEPECPHFSECGGCQWQFMSVEAQEESKRRIVASQLEHLGGLGEADVRAIRSVGLPYGYRNRMDYHVVDGQPALYRARSKQLIPLDVCPVLSPGLADLFGRLGPLAEVLAITIRGSERTGETIAVIRGAVPEQASDWGVSVVRVRRGRPVAEIGSTSIHEVVAGRSYRITANAFFQNNTAGAEALVGLVREALDPQPEDVLVDGYAGGGLFSVALAESVDEVIAIETSPLGLDDLHHNLEQAGAFASIIPAPFEEAVSEVAEWDLAVVDPPRAGLGRNGVAAVVSGDPRTIALVSCDPASLARDARGLVDAGYELEWVAPVDMFPQTYHIETVSRFTREPSQI